jgi:hypothetical protein
MLTFNVLIPTLSIITLVFFALAYFINGQVLIESPNGDKALYCMFAGFLFLVLDCIAIFSHELMWLISLIRSN